MAKNKTKKTNVILQPVRGMRDYLPEKQILREEMISKIKKVFEKYGFVPLQTPALEYASILGKKYGEEERLIFKFKFGDEELGLKYDQTVPLARVYATNPQLGKPFKRYVLDRSWRGERPQAGRLREFLQCDVDTLGTYDLRADAEILACINDALKEIGVENFTWKINSRKISVSFLKSCGVADIKLQVAMRAIDKLDKLSEDKIKKEMLEKGISEASVDTIFSLLKIRGDFEKIKKTIKLDPSAEKEILDFMSALNDFGVKNYKFDLSLVRGLDYYTGVIFEATSPNFKGTIAAGGRYDHLIELFSGVEVPATGATLGLDRIIDQLNLQGKKTKTKLFIITINQNPIPFVQKFRKAGINTDFDLMGRSLRKNLEFVNKLGIPYVAIIGEEETKQNKIKLKDMLTGKEKLLTFEEIITKLKNELQ
ncbi:MAG: histidine--tRNA ligase [Candidatus Nanoarchaeia archaeon]